MVVREGDGGGRCESWKGSRILGLRQRELEIGQTEGFMIMASGAKERTYVVMISWNSHIPRSDAATPRTAEETICVMGEVTLIESRLAMLMRNPNTP